MCSTPTQAKLQPCLVTCSTTVTHRTNAAPSSPRSRDTRARFATARPWRRAAPEGTRSGGRWTPRAKATLSDCCRFTWPSAPPSSTSARCRSHEEVVRVTEDPGSNTALPTDAAARPATGPVGRANLPRPPEPSTRRSEWTPGRITALAIGALLSLVGLIALGAGGTAVWASVAQRDDGYVTSDVQSFSTSGSALVTKPAYL